VKIVPFMR